MISRGLANSLVLELQGYPESIDVGMAQLPVYSTKWVLSNVSAHIEVVDRTLHIVA